MKLISKVFRGPAIESFHVGYAVAINHKKELIFVAGDPDYPSWIRSSCKPFQAAAMLGIGIAEEYGLTEEEIAVICASHNGEEVHVNTVQGILKKIDAGIENLKCGVHPPIDENSANIITLQGKRPTAIHNNCSGKHSGMLAASKKLGASLETYLDPHHPVQQKIIEKLKIYSEQEKIPVAVDGCSVPTFFLTMKNMALCYQKLAAEADQYLQTVFKAMTSNPYLVAGRNRFDTDLMNVTGGQIVSKAGAEGVQCLGIKTPEGSVGIALKVLDGNKRAAAPMTLAILKQLELIEESQLNKLAQYEKPVLKNHSGLEVGHIETETLAEEE